MLTTDLIPCIIVWTQFQTNKNKIKLLQFKNKQLLFIYSYPLSNRGDMAKATGDEVPENIDVVLTQLVLTQLAKCSPFPQWMVSQASWP